MFMAILVQSLLEFDAGFVRRRRARHFAPHQITPALRLRMNA
jgi:hypothetical protein